VSNLRGGSFEKQISSAQHKLRNFGVKKHGRMSKKTSSFGLEKKRGTILRDLKEYFERVEFPPDKLNKLMTDENISRFLDNRLEGLSQSSQINYLGTLNSMIEGLREVNITIDFDNNKLISRVDEIKKSVPKDTIKMDRSIANIDKVGREMYDKGYESGVIFELLKESGLRISEGFDVVNHLDRYYNEENGTLECIKGKGGRLYDPKEISQVMVEKIRRVSVAEMPSQNTFRSHLKDVAGQNITPHDIRFTYAKDLFVGKVREGMEYNQTMSKVSKELGHSRSSMTAFYLKRA